MGFDATIYLSVNRRKKTCVALAEWDSVLERKVVTLSQLDCMGGMTLADGTKFPHENL